MGVVEEGFVFPLTYSVNSNAVPFPIEVSLTIDWGDQTTTTTPFIPLSYSELHSYGRAGEYSVHVQVIAMHQMIVDASLCESFDLQIKVVNIAPEIIQFGPFTTTQPNYPIVPTARVYDPGFSEVLSASIMVTSSQPGQCVLPNSNLVNCPAAINCMVNGPPTSASVTCPTFVFTILGVFHMQLSVSDGFAVSNATTVVNIMRTNPFF